MRKRIKGKYRWTGALCVLMLLTSCQSPTNYEANSCAELLETTENEDDDKNEEEVGEEIVMYAIEEEEDLCVYDRPWMEVIRTEEGKEVERLYRELRGELASLPRHEMAQTVTLGELKDGIERSIETRIKVVSATGREWYEFDLGPFLEAAGIELVIFWGQTERFRNLEEKVQVHFNVQIEHLIFGDSPEAGFSRITIDDLERAIRRSIEDGVNYVGRAIKDGEFVE